MQMVVTGAAGFIGSALAEALITRGDDVVGIDSFTSYYGRATKEANVARHSLLESGRFRLVEEDLRTCRIEDLLEGADVVFHLAGQPGVRLSWATGFAEYANQNVLVTQRVLEAAKAVKSPRFVFASSSSIYGNAARYPTSEDDLPSPHSPYGVTKLAGEHLCGLYAANWGLSAVVLRYFTVYGPRQRPDMAFHRLIASALSDEPFPLYGDGSAIRDFTYVDDVIAATVAAAEADCPPGVRLNIAGGSSVSMTDLLDLAGQLIGKPVVVRQSPDQPGDVDRTGGSIERAQRLLGWAPKVSLSRGLAAQVAWHRDLANSVPPGDGVAAVLDDEHSASHN